MKFILYITGILSMASLFISCENNWFGCVDGNGVITTQERTVGTFKKVEANGDFKVDIYQGEEIGLEVEADENLMGVIVTRVSRDELIIETRHGECLRSSDNIRITVVAPVLNGIELNGSGMIWCDSLVAGTFTADLNGSGEIQCVYLHASTMDAEISGSGSMQMNGIFNQTNATIEGSGDIVLYGESENTDLNIIGSGNITGKDMQTDSCYTNISGSGSISTWVTQLLDVKISGSGNVYYYGEPPVVNTQISGSGQITKKEHLK
jgi:hypothetical protein